MKKEESGEKTGKRKKEKKITQERDEGKEKNYVYVLNYKKSNNFNCILL